MTKDNMPRGGLAAFGAGLAVLIGAAWYLVPRWALLWVFCDRTSFIGFFLVSIENAVIDSHKNMNHTSVLMRLFFLDMFLKKEMLRDYRLKGCK